MQIDGVGTLLELLFIVVISGVIARRLSVPYPIVMVLAGLVVGLVPWLPDVDLHPDIVFNVFLPLLVYHAAWRSSWRSVKRDLTSVIMLAVFLVPLTAFAVASVAPLLFTTLTWPMAFILGAVVAPTDELAATETGRSLKLRKHVVEIIEEESLLNDATALLLFQIGVAMLLGRRMPTPAQDVAQLAYVTFIGIVIGAGVGTVAEWGERFIQEPPLVVTSTAIVPFVAYFAADALHSSGVLAVVVCALVHSRHIDESRSAHVRLESAVVWNTAGYVLNGLIFVLIGLQLPDIFRALHNYSARTLVLRPLAFSALIIALRLLWVLVAVPGVTSAVNRLLRRNEPILPIRERFVVGWSSMRGVVSLAAAMSLPLTLAGGQLFPQRALLLFLTAFTVFFTLVGKGLTIPLVIRRLGLDATGEQNFEERTARRVIAQSALDLLESMRGEGKVHDDHYERAKRLYDSRVAALEDGDGGVAELENRFWEIRVAMLQAERDAAHRLRREERISDELFRALLRQIDLLEERIRPTIVT